MWLAACASLQLPTATPDVPDSPALHFAGRPRNWLGLLCGALVCAASAPEPVAAQTGPAIRLVDVAAEAGVTVRNLSGAAVKDYIIDSNGTGAAFLDYDGDGDLDLLVVNGSTLDRLPAGGDPIMTLYRNDGSLFVDRTAASGLTAKGWGQGVCVADFDNDGWLDFYLTAFGRNSLYRNGGDGTFVDVAAAAGTADTGWGASCAFGDYDRDGNVDLYLTNYVDFDLESVPKRGTDPPCTYLRASVFCGPLGLVAQPDVLFRNEGDGTFSDATAAAGVDAPPSYGLAATFADLQDDGWPDLYVANDSEPNRLFENLRDGTFREVALLNGVAVSGMAEPQAGMGVDAGDFDNDGDLDLFLTNFSQDHNTLYRNNGEGFFSDSTFATNLAAPSMNALGWSTLFVDLDDDGRLDLFIANGHIYHDVEEFGIGSTFAQPNQVYRNEGGGRFRDATAEIGGGLLPARSSRGAAAGDYDGDGDLDLFVVNLNDLPTLLRNDTASTNGWLSVQLVGRRSNHSGIGARLHLEAGELVQTAEVQSGEGYLSHGDLRQRFGLGDASAGERLEIRWPDGTVQAFVDLPADRRLTIAEGD